MKKILALAVALVLCFAVSAFAIQAEIPADTTAAIAKGGTQITIGGEFRFRGATYQNISDFNSYQANGGTVGASQRTVFESRIRLGVEAKVSPNTIGYIEVEGAGAAGATGENTNWGNTSGTNNSYGSVKLGEDKIAPLQIKQAWVQHSGSGLLGIPAYVKVGHQPVTIGAGIFYKHNLYGDDAIIAGITPIKGLDLTAVYVKLYEGTTNSSDDADVYSLIASYAINKDIVIGADATMVDLQNGSFWGAVNTTSGMWARLYNFGLNGKANISGFQLKGTFDFQTGRDNVPPHWKYGGYAATLGAAYTFAPVTLGLDFGYGSGDKKADNKVSTFQTLQGHTWSQPGTFVYEYLTNNAAGNLSGGLQNTFYAKFSAKADVVKDLNIGGSLTLLSAAQKFYGGGQLNDLGAATTSKYIGTEVDINASYQIDKGLKYFVEGGYLFAGNFWKGVAAAGYTSSGSKHISDPWGIRHGIQLNF